MAVDYLFLVWCFAGCVLICDFCCSWFVVVIFVFFVCLWWSCLVWLLVRVVVVLAVGLVFLFGYFAFDWLVGLGFVLCCGYCCLVLCCIVWFVCVYCDWWFVIVIELLLLWMFVLFNSVAVLYVYLSDRALLYVSCGIFYLVDLYLAFWFVWFIVLWFV